MKKFFLISVLLLSGPLSCLAQTSAQEWPIFRGKADLTGSTNIEVSTKPSLVWNLAATGRTSSSPVVSGGMIFFGNDKGTLIAVGTDGKIKWRYEGGSAAEAPPMVYGDKVIIGLSDGTLHAVYKTSGKLAWRYKTDGQIAGSANAWSTSKRSGIVIGSYEYYVH